jgi:putative SOS response-associated peptidase YedK
LLTTKANAVLQPIHDRMPVIVPQDDWERWFSSGELPDDIFQRLTAPYRVDVMKAVEVSPLVNSARVDDSRCVEPVVPDLI